MSRGRMAAAVLALAALGGPSYLEAAAPAPLLSSFRPVRGRRRRGGRQGGWKKTPARDAWARAIAKKRAQKQARKRQRRAK